MNPIQLQKNIVLASASPRRKKLLQKLDIPFEVRKLEVEEIFPSCMESIKVAQYLAEKKAEALIGKIKESELVLTADTVVVVENQVLNKPGNSEDAKKMLRQLSGNRHLVITGVCLMDTKRKITLEDTTVVYFNPLTEEEIDYYIHKYSPYDKAGAYGIQEWIGYIGVNRIEGSFYNVMGLPINMIYEVLKNWS